MSKSLGNVLDPLDVVAECGTDALRFTLATGAWGKGQREGGERQEGGRVRAWVGTGHWGQLHGAGRSGAGRRRTQQVVASGLGALAEAVCRQGRRPCPLARQQGPGHSVQLPAPR